MASNSSPREAFHITSLDGMRAVAIMIVFLSHAGLSHIVPGLFGVTVFFFLSGYLITTLLRMECERTGGVDMGQFFLRRALRILPPFYLVLGAIALLHGRDWQALTAQTFFAANVWEISGGVQPPGTEVLWSLAVEEHFYLLFPFFYLLLRQRLPERRHQFMALMTLCAAVLAWRMFLVHELHAIDLHNGSAHHPRTCHGTDTRLDGLLFGCALAVWGNPALDQTRIGRKAWLWLILPLCVAALLVSFVLRDVAFRETWPYTVQGLALMPVFIAVIRYADTWAFRFLNWPLVRRLGVLSYSFYLTHSLVIALIKEHLLFAESRVAQGAVALGATLILSWLMHACIERPCAHLRKRLGSHGNGAERPKSRFKFASLTENELAVVANVKNTPERTS